MITLRDDQQQAYEALREAYVEGTRRMVLQAPTGMGKTILAGYIIKRAREMDNRVIFTVPAITLIDQTVESLMSQGIPAIDIGVLQANHRLTDPSKPVQVASISTLARRNIPPAEVAIIDEAHRWYDFYEHWMNLPDWSDTPFIGLSATPWTKGLGKHFEKLIVGGTTANCIDMGILSKFRVFAPSHPDLTNVKTVLGDYHEGQLEKVMSGPSLVADIISTWQEKWGKDKTLCFCVNCAHAQRVAQKFSEAGIACGYQDASTPDDQRAEIKRRFHTGEIKVVCNVGTLTTGVDWDVRCLILARPTKSEILFVQIIGRALRTAPGKEHALILDHSDTHLRLGFVTDIHHEELDGGVKKPGESKEITPPKPVMCDACGYLNPPGMTVCANCGVEIKQPPTAEGELKEITPPKRKTQDELLQSVRDLGRATVYGQLMWVVNNRGYKAGWAAHKYREIFGFWPNGIGYAPPEYPDDNLMLLINRMQREWKRAQEPPPKPIPRQPDIISSLEDEIPWR